MARALITGGAGFIGSHLSEQLVERGDEVTALDDLSTGSADNVRSVQSSGRFRLVEGSVLDEPLVNDLVEQADVVYHLAAAVGVDWVLRHPLRSLETNIRGSENVLHACATSRKRVLIASTSEVYGKNDKNGLAEDDDRVLGSARLARWFYAAAKSVDESFALAYWHERQLPVTIVRLFNTVGPRQAGHYGMVVPRLVAQALRNEPLTVYGDGQQTRCFTNVRDVVIAFVALVDSPQAAGEIFNVGQPNEIRIIDLAQRIVELSGSGSEIRLVPYDAAEAYGERAAGFEEMRRRVPDASKLFRVTGVRAQTPLDETLRQVIDHQRACASSPAS